MQALDGTRPAPQPSPLGEVIYERVPRHLLDAVVARYDTHRKSFRTLEPDEILLAVFVAMFFLFLALNVTLTFAGIAVPLLVGFLVERHWPQYRRTPRQILRHEGELVAEGNPAGGDVLRIRFEDVRRVYPSRDDVRIRYHDGREEVIDWLPAARRAVLSVLQDAVLLQPLGGEPEALVPLLHVPPEERDLVGLTLPAGDADCPACGRHMPSRHWFAIDRPRRRVVCIDCAVTPEAPPPAPDAAARG